mgnify:CR=1 FL=1
MMTSELEPSVYDLRPKPQVVENLRVGLVSVSWNPSSFVSLPITWLQLPFSLTGAVKVLASQWGLRGSSLSIKTQRYHAAKAESPTLCQGVEIETYEGIFLSFAAMQKSPHVVTAAYFP